MLECIPRNGECGIVCFYGRCEADSSSISSLPALNSPTRIRQGYMVNRDLVRKEGRKLSHVSALSCGSFLFLLFLVAICVELNALETSNPREELQGHVNSQSEDKKSITASVHVNFIPHHRCHLLISRSVCMHHALIFSSFAC